MRFWISDVIPAVGRRPRNAMVADVCMVLTGANARIGANVPASSPAARDVRSWSVGAVMPSRLRSLPHVERNFPRMLLVCGVASSLLYGAMIWGIRYEGYSVLSQVPSELTAIGAPTERLWARIGWIYTPLLA